MDLLTAVSDLCRSNSSALTERKDATWRAGPKLAHSRHPSEMRNRYENLAKRDDCNPAWRGKYGCASTGGRHPAAVRDGPTVASIAAGLERQKEHPRESGLQ